MLTEDIGDDALDRFEQVVKEQRNNKKYIKNKKTAEWRDSHARKEKLEELPEDIMKDPSRDACSMDYFGEQTCEGNCWTYAALGMVVKFLQNDTVLYERHPFLVQYQRRLAAAHPLLNAELISRHPKKYLGKKVWNIYQIMSSNLTGQSKSISYKDTTIDGGHPVDFLVSLLLCARYRVTLKGFDHLGSTEINIDGRSKSIRDRRLKL